ncbi:MAG: hypothetical protein WBA89_24595 [Microcoleus sp.]
MVKTFLIAEALALIATSIFHLPSSIGLMALYGKLGDDSKT